MIRAAASPQSRRPEWIAGRVFGAGITSQLRKPFQRRDTGLFLHRSAPANLPAKQEPGILSCMSDPQWVPAELLQRAFTVSQGRAAGLSDGRVDSVRLERPFTGVRSSRESSSALEHARQYLPRLKPGQAFSGVTALRIHGLPWQTPWTPSEPIEIAVPGQSYAPRSRGVQGRRIARARFLAELVDGLPTLIPLTAVMTVAERLSLDHLTGLIDALVTPSQWYPGLRWRPYARSVAELEEASSPWASTPERTRVLRALALARIGVDSYQESRTRVILLRAGLPEPSVQVPVWTPSGLRHADGGWPDFKVCFEYEGEHHRTDAVQWHRDILRDEDFAFDGWWRIRVTKADLRPQQHAALVDRVRRALIHRGWDGQLGPEF